MSRPYPANMPTSQMSSVLISASGPSQASSRSRRSYLRVPAASRSSSRRHGCHTSFIAREVSPRGSTRVRSTLPEVSSSSAAPSSPEITRMPPIIPRR